MPGYPQPLQTFLAPSLFGDDGPQIAEVLLGVKHHDLRGAFNRDLAKGLVEPSPRKLLGGKGEHELDNPRLSSVHPQGPPSL